MYPEIWKEIQKKNKNSELLIRDKMMMTVDRSDLRVHGDISKCTIKIMMRGVGI